MTPHLCRNGFLERGSNANPITAQPEDLGRLPAAYRLVIKHRQEYKAITIRPSFHLPPRGPLLSLLETLPLRNHLAPPVTSAPC